MSVKLGYELLTERAGVTVSAGIPVLNPIENAFDWLPYDYYQNDITSVAPSISFNSTAAEYCDYIALYAHDMDPATDQWQLEHSFGTVLLPWQFVSKAPIFISFAGQSHTDWRLIFRRSGGGTPFSPRLGIVALGRLLDMSVGPQLNFTPPLFNAAEGHANRSMNGVFLGKSNEIKTTPISISFDRLDPAWVRTNWVPFLKHAQDKPFFVSWDETGHASEAAFAFSSKVLQPKYRNNTIMSGQLNAIGITA